MATRAVRAPAPRASLSTEDIVETALELIAEYGVEQLSMRQLSARLGSSLGATYRHVATKEALLQLCGEQLIERSFHPLAAGQDPLIWIREQVLHLYDVVRAHPGMAAYIVGQPDVVTMELITAVHDALIATGRSEVSSDHARLVLFFYCSGALLTDATTLLSYAGVAEPRQLIADGLDYILQTGTTSLGRAATPPRGRRRRSAS
ncbi:MAG TPA: TetR family transcriptional regulator [Mycobacteriales bacterium]|nr:TetR family transcriptional regulator [Mycobacteriales bacterium]